MIFACMNCAKPVESKKCDTEVPWPHFCSDDCAECWYESEDESLARDWCIGWESEKPVASSFDRSGEPVVPQPSHITHDGLHVPPAAKVHDVRQRSQRTRFYSRRDFPGAAAMGTWSRCRRYKWNDVGLILQLRCFLFEMIHAALHATAFVRVPVEDLVVNNRLC
jgi:hypothetical protein